MRIRCSYQFMPFLSTPSARRATSQLDAWLEAEHISIHALREEGDLRNGVGIAKGRYFYPRPPRGGRLPYCRTSIGNRLFLSTPSARRATFAACTGSTASN